MWKVLRDTEGERFVLRKKFAVFQENFKVATRKFLMKHYVSRLRFFFR
jgi:hypothetical protein